MKSVRVSLFVFVALLLLGSSASFGAKVTSCSWTNFPSQVSILPGANLALAPQVGGLVPAVYSVDVTRNGGSAPMSFTFSTGQPNPVKFAGSGSPIYTSLFVNASANPGETASLLFRIYNLSGSLVCQRTMTITIIAPPGQTDTIYADGNKTQNGEISLFCGTQSCSRSGDWNAMETGCSVNCLTGGIVTAYCSTNNQSNREIDELLVDGVRVCAGQSSCTYTFFQPPTPVTVSCAFTD